MFRSVFGIAPIWRNGVPFASLCPGGSLLFLMIEPFNSGVVIAVDTCKFVAFIFNYIEKGMLMSGL